MMPKTYTADTIADAPLPDLAAMLDACLALFTDHGRDLFDELAKRHEPGRYDEAMAWLEDLPHG